MLAKGTGAPLPARSLVRRQPSLPAHTAICTGVVWQGAWEGVSKYPWTRLPLEQPLLEAERNPHGLHVG